jgi:predicted Fe-Mo cluster-binding NifX family protein
MTVALTVWDDRISPVFDVARRILLIEVEDGEVTARREENLAEAPPIDRARKLVDLEVDTLVCGAVSWPVEAIISANGIETIPFVAGDVDEVIEAYLNGRLLDPELCMPGCRRRRLRTGGCRSGAEKWISQTPGRSGRMEEEDVMPGGDGTGPMGDGPKTGRGRGGCKPGQGTGQGAGRGRGGGAGRGAGRGRGAGAGRGGGAGAGGGGGGGRGRGRGPGPSPNTEK